MFGVPKFGDQLVHPRRTVQAAGVQELPVRVERRAENGRPVPLEVPAGADIVLEGHIDNADPVDEGPVSEFHGFYVGYGPGTGGAITCVTHRKDAVYQAILPGYASEHCLLGAVAIEAVTWSISVDFGTPDSERNLSSEPFGMLFCCSIRASA